MTTGRTGYGRVVELDPTQARLSALESSLAALSTYRRRYDVREFTSVQAAFDTIPSGACLFFPDGDYTPTVAAGWTRLCCLLL